MLTGSHVAHDICPHEDVSELTQRYCKAGSPAGAAVLRSVSDIAPFAMAAYGTLFYVYVNRRPRDIANFCCRAFCGCCGGGRGDGRGADAVPESPAGALAAAAAAEAASAPRRGGVLGLELDPSRVLTKAAVSAIAGVHARDVRHLSSFNIFNEQSPYFVALHRASRSVVISVRGTFRCAPRFPGTCGIEHPLTHGLPGCLTHVCYGHAWLRVQSSSMAGPYRCNLPEALITLDRAGSWYPICDHAGAGGPPPRPELHGGASAPIDHVFH